MGSKATHFQIIRSDAMIYAQGHALSQGYQGMTLAGEQSRLNMEWERRDVGCNRVLSPAAILAIEANEREGLFSGRDGQTEPPFMAPSTDPNQYSKVCRMPACMKQLRPTVFAVVLTLYRLCDYPHPLLGMQGWGLLHEC